MELTKQQIQRINDFLEGIGVEYVDVRFEMIDHIASEIENKIENIPAFFENKGFQTPFIKYMLSQKKKYLNEYKKLKNESFWYYTKKVLISMFQQMTKSYNLGFILLFLSATYFLSVFKIKYASEIIFTCFISSFLFIAIKFNQLRKRFGEIRIIRSYTKILLFNSIIALHLPSFTPILNETPYSPIEIYTVAIMLAINYLAYLSFMNQKESIEQYATNFYLN
ncbi:MULTISPECIES: hypothetical protein [unclassified Tenacibaculum]|uniref:hypothetical protein n=1 Tax=unclassified Tenacibaculum TaxID=2635139 RepID=UPI001F256932|nr:MULTISPECIES: hypothetical protein [unclassified Tenacibaculum]MCF2876076.1 hypothetical protein [Tenacibaculum sp. Cn5-1]MCF2936151.1 hypothetical protein [Tenacibaculum sp. Cn5-34]MCG7512712.1 hypothetical protein [Tenacibaculum sp. Cn5-46]